jgi:hypothetical protein
MKSEKGGARNELMRFSLFTPHSSEHMRGQTLPFKKHSAFDFLSTCHFFPLLLTISFHTANLIPVNRQECASLPARKL